MDIEHLTKSQIVLLTLLVSFMTSIATGIVTVSLLQQAPPPITQTINRVVERTVERVVETKKDKTGNTVTNEKTVVVKETDLISDAVKSALPSVVAIYKSSAPTENKDPGAPSAQVTPPAETQAAAAPAQAEPVFVGRGVFVGAKTIATDVALLEEGATYSITLIASGASAKVASIEKKDGVALFTVGESIGKALKSDDVTSLQLGETLVELAGEARVRVSTGIISDIERNTDGKIQSISIAGTEGAFGSPIVSLDGLLVGINTKKGVVLAGSW